MTWSPRADHLQRHPQLASLAALAHQLALTTEALAASHRGDPEATPLLHQARGIAHLARVLRHQIDAYRKLASPPAATTSAPSQAKKRR